MGQFYDTARSRTNLEQAARAVCARGSVSRSKEIRVEVENFERHWTSHIENIQRKLREGRFRFAPQRVVFIPRAGKKPRPIIIAPIENRIMQRAILQALGSVPAIRDVLAIPWSVGGIEGVDSGIALIRDAISFGAKWYLRADIPNFFGSIPRAPIVEFIETATADGELTALFTTAIETVAGNADSLDAEELDLLPDEETGVAQGSALSALVGNILLRGFDEQMQGGPVCPLYR